MNITQDSTIYVFGGSGTHSELIYKSRKVGLDNNLAVFGYSWHENMNLTNGYATNEYFGKAKFLLNIKANASYRKLCI
jgi:hypothetical protein